MSKNLKTDTLVPISWQHCFQPKSILVTLAVLAFFDLAFYLLAVLPNTHRERESQLRNEQLASQVEQKRTGLGAVLEAVKRLEKVNTEGLTLVEEITLERRSAFSALLSELGEAATKAGVEIRETSYLEEAIEGSDHYGIVSINANFRGRHDNLVSLLYQLDRSKLFFIIGSLGATPRDESNSRDLQINMRFDIFVREL